MKLTLLEIVQDMLVAIEAEGVDDVTDTDESLMCVNHANGSFESLIYEYQWKHLGSLSQLSATTPLNCLVGPANTINISRDTVTYQNKSVKYVKPEEFRYMTQGRNGANVTVLGNLNIYTDRNPTFFTSFDDEVLTFDSMPTVGGLVATDALAYLFRGPAARLSTNSQIFDLPAKAFPILKEHAVAMAVKLMKGDTTTGETMLRDVKNKMARYTQLDEMVFGPTDIRSKLVTRRTSSPFHRRRP